ncbi:molybdopterin-guanine dinucleotide biosynthesis protein B [Thermodesulfobacteriota bacterium]
MIPIVSIVGKSNVGKTTFLEKVVRELKSRGYRIATIKHDAHSFEIDHEGKDSWRHKQAGARTTIISSAEKLAMVTDTDHDQTLDEIREQYMRDVDIIISEGYKREKHPKIEVFRQEKYPELLCSDDDNLLAIAGDPQNAPDGVPRFPLNDAAPICSFLEERFLKE